MTELGLSRLEHCRLCPRACGVNRLAGQAGYCGATGEGVRLAGIMLLRWEEPCISAPLSGAVFFAHCSMHCVYCQNYAISGRSTAATVRTVSVSELARIFLHLQEQGAGNLNLVTPTHYAAQIAPAIRMARANGLTVPVAYNTSGYESTETLRFLDGLVDIYLCDYKYWTDGTAALYSAAPDYREAVRAALTEMYRQTGAYRLDARGRMERGVLVRHLVLPGHAYAARKILTWLYSRFQNNIVYSVLRQYTPLPDNPALARFPELLATVTDGEYDEVIAHATQLGLACGYLQERASADSGFVPDWSRIVRGIPGDGGAGGADAPSGGVAGGGSCGLGGAPV